MKIKVLSRYLNEKENSISIENVDQNVKLSFVIYVYRRLASWSMPFEISVIRCYRKSQVITSASKFSSYRR